MGIVSRLRSAAPERRAFNDFWAQWAQGNVDSRDSWDTYLNPQAQALRLGVVFGCVSLISARISALPVNVILPSGDRLRETDPRAPWIDRPDPFSAPHGMTRHDLLSALTTSLLLDGNAYFAVGRDRAMRPQEIQPLNPYTVELERKDNRIMLRVDGREPNFEVRAIRNVILPGELRGLSPIRAAKHLLDIGFGVQTQSAQFFQQGAILAGVISSKNAMTAEQMGEIAAQWQRHHAGANRSHLPLVLEGAEYQPISVSPEDAQFLETRGFTDAQIAGQIFHCDPSLLGITSEGSSITYQNVGQRNRQLLDDALIPLMVRLEKAFSSLLPSGQQYRFDTAEFIRADTKTRFETYQIASNIGLLSVAEMREREGLPTKPDLMPTPPPPMPEPAESEMEMESE